MTEFQTGVIRPVECMKEGWELIKNDYWLIFGVTVVGLLIGGIIPLGLGIGAMFCGIYYVILRKIDGQPVEFGDLFKGFNYFVPGLVATLVVIIPTIISVFIIYGSMVGFILTLANTRGSAQEGMLFGMFATLFIEAVIVSLVLSCIHALIMFAYPLIAERNLGGFEAFKLSARAVWANLSGVIGIILVEFVMGMVGYLVFVVGIYFIVPIMFAGVAVAYRRVFPKQQNFQNPPPPNYYQGI